MGEYFTRRRLKGKVCFPSNALLGTGGLFLFQSGIGPQDLEETDFAFDLVDRRLHGLVSDMTLQIDEEVLIPGLFHGRAGLDLGNVNSTPPDSLKEIR